MVAFTGKYVAPEKKRFPVPSGRYNGEVVGHRQTKTAAGDRAIAVKWKVYGKGVDGVHVEQFFNGWENGYNPEGNRAHGEFREVLRSTGVDVKSDFSEIHGARASFNIVVDDGRERQLARFEGFGKWDSGNGPNFISRTDLDYVPCNIEIISDEEGGSFSSEMNSIDSDGCHYKIIKTNGRILDGKNSGRLVHLTFVFYLGYLSHPREEASRGCINLEGEANVLNDDGHWETICVKISNGTKFNAIIRFHEIDHTGGGDNGIETFIATGVRRI